MDKLLAAVGCWVVLPAIGLGIARFVPLPTWLRRNI
jgi:hypothetical protein